MLKPSDITIITSDLPPEVVEKPNKETTNLLELLLSSDYFNDFVDCFLAENGTEVLSIDDFIQQLKEKFQTGENPNDEEFINSNKAGFEHFKNTKSILYDPFQKEFNEFVSLLSLPISFAWDIFLLIQFKAFREIAPEDYPLIDYLPTPSDISDELDHMSDYSVSGALWFQHQISKTDLIQWIENNWQNIESDMREYLPQSPIKETYFQDMELTNEMYILYKQGNTPTQILKILVEKYSKGDYENNSEIYDKLSVDFIKNKLSRFKKLLAREINPKDGFIIKKKDSITILG